MLRLQFLSPTPEEYGPLDYFACAFSSAVHPHPIHTRTIRVSYLAVRCAIGIVHDLPQSAIAVTHDKERRAREHRGALEGRGMYHEARRCLQEARGGHRWRLPERGTSAHIQSWRRMHISPAERAGNGWGMGARARRGRNSPCHRKQRKEASTCYASRHAAPRRII